METKIHTYQNIHDNIHYLVGRTHAAQNVNKIENIVTQTYIILMYKRKTI